MLAKENGHSAVADWLENSGPEKKAAAEKAAEEKASCHLMMLVEQREGLVLRLCMRLQPVF
jgi:hypothetical protein